MRCSITSLAPRLNLACLTVLLLCGAFSLAGCGGSNDPKDQEPALNSSSRANPLASLYRVKVGVRKSADDDPANSYDCWVAANPSQRDEGLSYVSDLEMPAGKRKGMVLVFPANTQQAIWGKDTLVPLDVAFAERFTEGVGRVVKIGTINSFQRTVLTSDVPVKYVLEVRKGDLNSTKLKVGDLIYVPVTTPAN